MIVVHALCSSDAWRRVTAGLVVAYVILVGQGCAHRRAAAGATSPGRVGEAPDEIRKSEAPAPGTATVDASDPWPHGLATPEGAACDLARAFILADEAMFRGVCVDNSGGFADTRYAAFLEEATAAMKRAHEKGIETAGGPKEITRVYAFRHLSKNGPASFVFASNLGKDIGFVDVEAQLHVGGLFKARTLVIQLASGDWRVIPTPDVFPLLSDGLTMETESTVEWKTGGERRAEEKQR